MKVKDILQTRRLTTNVDNGGTLSVREILEHKKNKKVWSIKPHEKVLDAVHVLNAHKIGALMVVDENDKPVGIITERDIMNELNYRYEELPSLTVKDVMTDDPICGVIDEDINYVMNIMTSNRIRHLPIFDKEKLVGMISIGDVVNNLLEKTQVENHLLQDYLQLSGQL